LERKAEVEVLLGTLEAAQARLARQQEEGEGEESDDEEEEVRDQKWNV
jgi:hypothetical protein